VELTQKEKVAVLLQDAQPYDIQISAWSWNKGQVEGVFCVQPNNDAAVELFTAYGSWDDVLLKMRLSEDLDQDRVNKTLMLLDGRKPKPFVSGYLVMYGKVVTHRLE
jgi:hypothetical protein